MKQIRKLMILALTTIMTGCSGTKEGVLVFRPVGIEDVKDYAKDIYSNRAEKNKDRKVSYSITKDVRMTNVVSGVTKVKEYKDIITVDADFTKKAIHFTKRSDPNFIDPNLGDEVLNAYIFDEEKNNNYAYYVESSNVININHRPFVFQLTENEKIAEIISYTQDIIGCEFITGYARRFSTSLYYDNFFEFYGDFEKADFEIAYNKNGYLHYDVTISEIEWTQTRWLFAKAQIDDYLCTSLRYELQEKEYDDEYVLESQTITTYVVKMEEKFNDFALPVFDSVLE